VGLVETGILNVFPDATFILTIADESEYTAV
jgi:hypothetical protein